ncbi:MAG: RNA-binding protein [Clostridiales bacterium]|nr:RNA-binding protein [Clostridiales bacterium]
MATEKQKKAELLARDKDEALLGRRLIDLDTICSKKRDVVFTGFLSEAEQAYCEMLFHTLDSNVKFMGGYDNAQRCVAVLFWEDVYELDENELPYKALKIEYSQKVSHRDVLGSILGLGIERSAVGDILVWDDRCYVFVTNQMCQYISQNLFKIGRQTVNVSEIPVSEVEIPELQTKLISATVASLRLDSVVGEGFRLSREDAKNAVQRGLVSLNHRIIETASHSVAQNDVISLRGKGKIVISAIGNESKKGRIHIEILCYL